MGSVYWLTGLSGAGKTTIGKELCKRLKAKKLEVVFLDGDELRNVFGGVFGYTLEERKKCAGCYSRLCKLLSEQGINVICCTISMFDGVRDWNRQNISDYIEVYIKVSQEELQKRNQKGLYSGVKEGRENNVMGMDIEIEEPKTPDVVIDNDGLLDIEGCLDLILKK